MRKITKRSLTKLLDKEISRITRLKGYCVKCNKEDNLQCCHIFSRIYRSTRWDLHNVLCLCAGCHFWNHKNPILFAEFVKIYLGKYNYNNLKLKATMIKKWTLEEMQELLEDLKEVNNA